MHREQAERAALEDFSLVHSILAAQVGLYRLFLGQRENCSAIADEGCDFSAPNFSNGIVREQPANVAWNRIGSSIASIGCGRAAEDNCRFVIADIDLYPAIRNNRCRPVSEIGYGRFIRSLSCR